MLTKTRSLAVSVAIAMATVLSVRAAPAVAQNADTSATSSGIEEVLVTARRREESIVDVPLAISVVTSEQLSTLGIKSTKDLANYVPGLEFNDFTPGYSRNDRGGARALVFRGLAIGLGSGGVGVTSAGSLFLDGAAVVGNEVPSGMDIGAVEVLRGPQSVYFGRSTMTGAVSYRTKAIPDAWQIDTALEIAQRDARRFEASAAGPIKAGLLGIRISGLTEETDGYVRNNWNNGASKLGARSRDSISATLDFTPSETFEAKAYYNQFSDEDGPAATAFLPSQLSSYQVLPGAIPPMGGTPAAVPVGCNTSAPVTPTPCIPTRFTFRGEIPGRENSVNYMNENIPTNFANAIFASPLVRGEDFKRQLGMQRAVVNTHLNLSWKLSDYMTLTSITGYHTNVTMQAADGIGQVPTIYFSNSQYYYSISNKSDDISQELRLSSDPERQFSWTVGANYVDATAKVNAIVAFQFQTAGTGVQTTFTPIPQNISIEQAKTSGVFAGGYLKLLDDKLTLSAEGRYQQDLRGNEQYNVAGTRLLDLSSKFNSFNPRVAADYDVGEGRKVYASYSTGTRPGGFNGTLKTFLDRNDPALNAQLLQFLGVVALPYDEEKLSIFELGFKGFLPSGKGYFDINAYAGKVTDQQVPFGALIPLLGFTVTATTNIGETEIHGVEWQGNYRFSPSWSVSSTAAWNYAERTKFTSTSGYALAGTSNYDGKKMANAPEISGSAVLTYERPLPNDYDWFTNLAAVYRGKQYMDAFNLAYIKGRTQLDLRLGVSREKLRVEAYALNLTNNQDYTGGNVATDFGGPGDAATTTGGTTGGFSTRRFAFFGAWAPPRQVGLRLNYSF